MDKLSILVQLEAKPGKEHEVEQFLKSALPLVQAETGTTTWYALKMGPSKFGIFDTFAFAKRAFATSPPRCALRPFSSANVSKIPNFDGPIFSAYQVVVPVSA